MKYTIVRPKTKNSMRLQSVGLVLGTPAGQIKKNDYLMWNFGSVYVVLDIINETPKTLTISTQAKEGGKIYEQKLLKTRLVCILEK